MRQTKTFENVTFAVEFLKKEFKFNSGEATHYVINNSFIEGYSRTLSVVLPE